MGAQDMMHVLPVHRVKRPALHWQQVRPLLEQLLSLLPVIQQQPDLAPLRGPLRVMLDQYPDRHPYHSVLQVERYLVRAQFHLLPPLHHFQLDHHESRFDQSH